MIMPIGGEKKGLSITGMGVRRLLPVFFVGVVLGFSVLPVMNFLKFGGQHWNGYDALLRRDHLNLAKYLRGGGDPDARYQDGITLLQKASAMGDATSVFMLLSSGAEVDIRSRFGYTALATALSGLARVYHHIELGDIEIDKELRNDISERIKVIDMLLGMGRILMSSM